MDTEQVKRRIGRNIADYRKRSGWTQAGLAEKLNYTDKAVSKWERGESVPDVLTMMQLAEQFGVSLDTLVSDPDQLPETSGTLEKAISQVSEKALRRKANKNIILGLSSTLVWFVALFFFVVLSAFRIPHSLLPFCYAIPANAIVLLSLRSAWHDFRWNRGLISVIVWGTLLSVYATLLALWSLNLWTLLLLGIPGQIAICLWFRLFRLKKKETEQDGQ